MAHFCVQRVSGTFARKSRFMAYTDPNISCHLPIRSGGHVAIRDAHDAAGEILGKGETKQEVKG